MRIPTLEYSANTPIVKQITAPTNSMYAVGVKVTKDGQVVDGNLSVDGISASTKIGDYSIIKLSSDGFEGMKILNIAVDKSATFQGEISAENELSNTVPTSRQLALEIPLSAYFDAPLTITPHDINVEMFQFRTTGLSDDYGQFEDITTLQAEKDRVISFRNVGGDVSYNQLYCYQNTNGYSQNYPSYCWHYFKTGVGNVSEFGPRTLPLSATIYFGYKLVGKKTKAQIRGAVSIDTHDGLNVNFPLQVMQKDMGYFEKDDDAGSDITTT